MARGSKIRAALLALPVLLIALSLFTAGCNKPSPEGDTGNGGTGKQTTELAKSTLPWIKATPNPVPSGQGPGKTTVTWDTGNDSWGQVYLAAGKEPEKMFSAGPSGSQEAPWINKGGSYEFRLYAGKEHEKVLATVKVTRE